MKFGGSAGTRAGRAKEGFQTCPSRWRLEMTTDLEALVVADYVFADEYAVPARPGRPSKVGDAELVALAACQAAMGISSDRQFLGLVERVLPGWFPASTRPVAVQPAAAPARRATRERAAAAGPLARRRRCSPRRREADRRRQLPGLRGAQRLRRRRPLRLRQVQASLRLRRPPRARLRPAWPAARLHACAGQREGVRADR